MTNVTFLVSFNYDAELAENSIPPSVKRGSVKRLAVTQILGSFPSIGEVFVRDFSGSADSLYKPRVFL